jgi:hypothetical protein
MERRDKTGEKTDERNKMRSRDEKEGKRGRQDDK